MGNCQGKTEERVNPIANIPVATSPLPKSNTEKPNIQTLKNFAKTNIVKPTKKIQLLSENSIEETILCLRLCELAESRDKQGRDRVKKKMSSRWVLSQVETWTCGEMIAITGLISSMCDSYLVDVPFVVIGGEYSKERSSEEVILCSSKNIRIGSIPKLIHDSYDELRSLGLLDWISKAIGGKSNCFITGHGISGAIASLIAVELIVDSQLANFAKYLEEGNGNELKTVTVVESFKAPTSSLKKNNFEDDEDDDDLMPSSGTSAVPINTFWGGTPADKTEVEEHVITHTIAVQRIPNLVLITFGAPRFFDAPTADCMYSLQDTHTFFRFINSGDILPSLAWPFSPAAPLSAVPQVPLKHFGDAVHFRAANKSWFHYVGFADFGGDPPVPADDPGGLGMASNSLESYSSKIIGSFS